MIKLYFLRHGESEKNILKIHSCSLEKFPLTEKGRRDVEAYADEFNEPVDIILCSPMLRARQTAEIFKQKLQVEIVQDYLLTEFNSGAWNEVDREKLKAESEEYRRYKQLPPAEKIKYKSGGHGESREDVQIRTRLFVKELLKKYQNKTILIVAHGCTYAALKKVIHDCEPEEYFKHENIGHNSIQEFFVDEHCIL
jgi:broad specificity phosphatase PhoE